MCKIFEAKIGDSLVSETTTSGRNSIIFLSSWLTCLEKLTKYLGILAMLEVIEKCPSDVQTNSIDGTRLHSYPREDTYFAASPNEENLADVPVTHSLSASITSLLA